MRIILTFISACFMFSGLIAGATTASDYANQTCVSADSDEFKCGLCLVAAVIGENPKIDPKDLRDLKTDLVRVAINRAMLNHKPFCTETHNSNQYVGVGLQLQLGDSQSIANDFRSVKEAFKLGPLPATIMTTFGRPVEEGCATVAIEGDFRFLNCKK